MVVAIEQHVEWITDCLDHLRQEGYRTIEPVPEAQADWVAHAWSLADGTIRASAGCNSWYLGANVPGKPRVFMAYLGGLPDYRERCDQIAASGYPGFVRA